MDMAECLRGRGRGCRAGPCCRRRCGRGWWTSIAADLATVHYSNMGLGEVKFFFGFGGTAEGTERAERRKSGKVWREGGAKRQAGGAGIGRILARGRRSPRRRRGAEVVWPGRGCITGGRGWTIRSPRRPVPPFPPVWCGCPGLSLSGPSGHALLRRHVTRNRGSERRPGSRRILTLLRKVAPLPDGLLTRIVSGYTQMTYES